MVLEKKTEVLKLRKGHLWPGVLFETLRLAVRYNWQTHNKRTSTPGDLPHTQEKNVAK